MPIPGSTPFDQLRDTDLIVDRPYEGGRLAKNVLDDPINQIIHPHGARKGVGLQGGFRYSKAPDGGVRLIVLYTTGAEPDWPDELDVYSGQFVYYGDNRRPGRELHDTQRGGNRLLVEMFERSRGTADDRSGVAPFLLFQKVPDSGRDVRFRGLLAPGGSSLSTEEELVAVWRSTEGQRFQNYRAHFTILDVPTVSRSWINDIRDGNPLSPACPPAWRQWVKSRTYKTLLAPPTVIIRRRADQLPENPTDLEMLEIIHKHFSPRPTDFEQFAADLWLQSDAHVDRIDLTRPWRDGGRDAVGEFLIGPKVDPVAVEFALEAKCYAPGTGVGVKAASRLISGCATASSASWSLPPTSTRRLTERFERTATRS